MRQLLQRRRPVDLWHVHLPQNEVLQKRGFDTGRTGGARKNIVDEEVQRSVTLGVRRILDLVDDFTEKCSIVNGLRMQSLAFAVFNFLEVRLVLAHRLGVVDRLRLRWAERENTQFRKAGGFAHAV